MRIAMFEDTYWPKIDGINTSVELFTRELRKRGHEVLVIAPKHPSPDYSSQPVDDDTILLQSVQTEWLYPGTALGKFWKGMGKGVVAERFARWRPDILHSHTEFTIGLWMGSYWRTKLGPLGTRRVHTYHTLWTEYLFYLPLPEAATQPIVRWIAPRTTKKRYDGVIAPTEKMREVLISDWVSAPSGRPSTSSPRASMSPNSHVATTGASAPATASPTTSACSSTSAASPPRRTSSSSSRRSPSSCAAVSRRCASSSPATGPRATSRS
jgi:glycosyltransferase involved in cell wall biosynthesis